MCGAIFDRPARRALDLLGWGTLDGGGFAGKATIGYGASTSLSVSKIGSRWLSLSSAFSLACDQGKAIYAASSGRLTGPFTPPQKIYEIDDVVAGHYPFFYTPEAHPESGQCQ